ncbi:Histone-fold [Pseudocohnilembus persalinus]|uniref:Histone-fold n=1 Tax=Pseudocohnilembus persalinus TaxID=266149 RepID=A0A0V0Q9H3_PSEPJ|nr:Histone-fold [Pseudocohnilembus persalinus]|eukprot:KRW98888.1 Histone-fold [Pseudocohnilembus persalinus]
MTDCAKIWKEMSQEFSFPISRIKGILKADDSMKGINKESLMYLEKACEFFGQLLIQKSYRNMASNKRKTMQSIDLDTISKQDPYLNFIQCIFQKSNEIKTYYQENEQEKMQEELASQNVEQQEKLISQKPLKHQNKIQQTGNNNLKYIEPPKNNKTLDMFLIKKN